MNKFSKFASLLFLVAVLVAPAAVFAQDAGSTEAAATAVSALYAIQLICGVTPYHSVFLPHSY